MAIATNGGHVSRALDFYNAAGKYFILGGTTPWTHIEEGVEITDDSRPATPDVSDYRLNDIVGLKRIDNISLVRPATELENQNPTEENLIKYRNQNWKRVEPVIRTKLATQVTEGSTVIQVESVASLTKVGTKIRIADTYEGNVVSYSGLYITLDTAAPKMIPSGSPVVGGAMVEGAKYVYVDCYLNYDEFPIVDTENKPLSYRQIGLCTGVTPNTEDILKSAAYSNTGVSEYTSLGTLEILDNRVPSTRDINQREQLSLIIEF